MQSISRIGRTEFSPYATQFLIKREMLMLKKSIRSQIVFLLRQWTVQLVFFVLLGLSLINFTENLNIFKGCDAYNILHPTKMLLISVNKCNGYACNSIFFVQIYPLLVALPAALNYVTEDKQRINVYIVSRMDPFCYKIGKWVAVFVVTALVFSVPSLLELLLNVIVFPSHANFDLLTNSAFNQSFYDTMHNYLFADLYFINPYLHAVVCILFFGCCSGVLAVFSMSLTTVFPLKFRILYLLPPYILLMVYNALIQKLISYPERQYWYQYFLLHTEYTKYTLWFFIALGALTVLSLIWTLLHRRRGYV